ncbi:MAG: DUF433 domain-containing protein [Planctomycetia bacterium]|nr:DUF433 domain-containing protein [Planctomycetia bacterium]
MAFKLVADAPPLRVDESGAVRVGSSRVLLDLVIGEFEGGASAEEIVRSYPTTALEEIYSVIAYYLRHRNEIQAYLVDRERAAASVRQRIEAQQGDLAEIRNRLIARRRP